MLADIEKYLLTIEHRKHLILPKIIDLGEKNCHVWTMSHISDGYAQYTWGYQGKIIAVRIHRLIYILKHGPIANNLVIDHLCKNRACVNVNHLELVTTAQNVWRGNTCLNKEKSTHCPSGHEFTPANCYYHRNYRYCRTCRKERSDIATYKKKYG